MIFIRKLLEPLVLFLLAFALSYVNAQMAHAGEPEPLPIGTLVQAIDNSQERVWLASDYITHPELATALKKAFDRHVDVQLLIRTPRKLGYSAGSYLANAGVKVYLHDAVSQRPKNFLIVDQRALNFRNLKLSELSGTELGRSNPRTEPARPVKIRFDQRASTYEKHFEALKKQGRPLVSTMR